MFQSAPFQHRAGVVAGGPRRRTLLRLAVIASAVGRVQSLHRKQTAAHGVRSEMRRGLISINGVSAPPPTKPTLRLHHAPTGPLSLGLPRCPNPGACTTCPARLALVWSLRPPSSAASANLGWLASLLLVPIATAACGAGTGVQASPHAPASSASQPPPTQESTRQPTTASNDTACPTPAAGDQTMPTAAIPATSWDSVTGIPVPRAASYGPRTEDNDGLRRCYSHSPTGALFAAYNYLVAMSPPDDASGEKTFSALRRIMSPGPDRDHYFDYLRSETDAATSNARNEFRLVGYTYVTTSPDRVVIIIATQVGASYVSSWWRLNWQDGDWKVATPKQGERAGDPYDRLTDLTGFVTWQAP
jgi:hypothetical protein